MRFDKKGLHTLDEDIINIWEKHGWNVTEIRVRKNDWTITAKRVKNVKRRIEEEDTRVLR